MPKLVLVLVYLVMGYGRADGNSSLYSRAPDIIAHLCPGSDVCTSNRTSKRTDASPFNEGFKSCCSECSCSANCSKISRCCFPNTSRYNQGLDVKLQKYRNTYSCLYLVFPQPTRNQNLYQSFSMVSSVQKAVTKEHFNVSCGDINVAPWGSLYPVFSTKSKQIYKNIECAREDGEDSDLVFSEAVISCKDEAMRPGIIEAINGIDKGSFHENCDVRFIFPGDSDFLELSICFTDLIDTCSESHDFEVPNGVNATKDEIRKLCTKSGIVAPYRAEKIYANVFCHICNTETFYRHRVCKIYTGGSFAKGDKAEGFMALIDSKYIAETRNVKEEKVPVACSNKNVNKCRQVFCPTGQLRTRASQCDYPNKIWLNQAFTVFVNLTFYKYINLSEVFNINQRKSPSTELQFWTSKWLHEWSVHSMYYRLTEVPHLSNNILVVMNRKPSSVEPQKFIPYVNRLTQQPWSFRLGNVTEVTKLSSFSEHKPYLSSFSSHQHLKMQNDFVSITKDFETPQYSNLYSQPMVLKNSHIITKLYICDQVKLESSEFLLNVDKKILFIFSTKRFLFDNQFELVRSKITGELQASICVENSGMYDKDKAFFKNSGTKHTHFGHYFVVLGQMFILLYRVIY